MARKSWEHVQDAGEAIAEPKMGIIRFRSGRVPHVWNISKEHMPLTMEQLE
jgi:hypothetical protein